MVSNASAPRRRWLKRALLAGGALLVLAILATVGVKLWADQYLRSDKFRHFVNGKLSKTLKADTELAPFQYQGLTVFSDHLKAQGNFRAPSHSSSGSYPGGVQHPPRLGGRLADRAARSRETGRGTRGHQGSRSAGSQTRKTRREVEEPARWTPSWIPNRVEVGTATIKDASLRWSDGRLTGTAIQLQPSEGGWEIGGTGGTVAHGALPKLTLDKLRLRYRPPFVYVQNVELREGSGGSLNVTGEVEMNKRLDLQAKVNRLPIGPLLPEDWRARLRGNLSGDINILSLLPAQGTPALSGTVHLTEGSLEALPVLDQIAIFTRTAQFRRLALTRATGEFQRNEERLTVQNFVAESAGLIRLEGAFQVEGKRIDGNFEVGVTPSSLQWLPGSQARVFTVARDGYLWAPMRLVGPLEKPTEDLSPRLIAAAQGEIIDQATGTARDVIDSAKEAAKSALDLLLGR